MNVLLVLITVTVMQSVPTLLEASSAPVTLDTKEMESLAEVRPGCTWSTRLEVSRIFVHLDIDECAIDIDNCDSNARCTNTPGSFTCTCNPGYIGDGVTCRGKEHFECDLMTVIHFLLFLAAVECPPLTLRFGIIRFTNANLFLSLASHECNPGYDLVGDKTRVCQANATWSGRTVSCRKFRSKDYLSLKFQQKETF